MYAPEVAFSSCSKKLSGSSDKAHAPLLLWYPVLRFSMKTISPSAVSLSSFSAQRSRFLLRWLRLSSTLQI